MGLWVRVEVCGQGMRHLGTRRERLTHIVACYDIEVLVQGLLD
jgi:hypothetical protein